MAPAVGASGAILGIAGAMTTLYPHSQFGIIFLPGLAFSGQTLVTGMLVFDLLGLFGFLRLLGLTFRLDHAAHIAGLVGGIAVTTNIKEVDRAQRWLRKRWRRIKREVGEGMDSRRK